MNDYLLDLVRRYKSKGVFIDTNLLLLYVVGSVGDAFLRSFSRTADHNYTVDDFDRLSKFVDFFEAKITSPHILTEVCDLFGNRTHLNPLLAGYISKATEVFRKSTELCSAKSFLQFGLADTAVVNAAKNSYLVVTDDGPLFGFLRNAQIDVVNLNDIRAI